MYQLSLFLCKWMYREDVIREDDMETCQYGLQITMANMINFLIMMIIGGLFGSLWETGLFYVVFVSLRLFCGGYHADSYGKCFLMFALTCLISTVAVRLFFQYATGLCFLFWAVIFLLGMCICKKVPIEHVNHPLSVDERKLFKKKSLIVYMFWCMTGILLWYLQMSQLFLSIISAFIMVLIYMFI